MIFTVNIVYFLLKESTETPKIQGVCGIRNRTPDIHFSFQNNETFFMGLFDFRSKKTDNQCIEGGNNYLKLGRYTEAVALYDQAIAINPTAASVWYNRGIALGYLSKYEESVASYERATAINPDYADAWSNRGVMLFKRGQYTEAVASCDKALSINSNDAMAWNNRGNALDELGQYTEALASYDKAIEIKPDYANARFNRETTLKKQINDGISGGSSCYKCGNAIVEENPDAGYPGVTKGSFEITDPKPICKSCRDRLYDDGHSEEFAKIAIYTNEKRIDDAIKIMQSFFDKENDTHWYNLGNLYYNKKQFSDALDCYDNALLLNTHYIKAWYRKGTILITNSNSDDAVKCFKNVILLDPLNRHKWNEASAFSIMLCSILIHNRTISAGKNGKETNLEVIKWIKECELPFEFATQEGYTLEKSGINGIVDYWFLNSNKILNRLEPKAADGFSLYTDENHYPDGHISLKKK